MRRLMLVYFPDKDIIRKAPIKVLKLNKELLIDKDYAIIGRVEGNKPKRFKKSWN